MDMIMYQDADILIKKVLDDNGDAPLSFIYSVENCKNGNGLQQIDIRSLNEFNFFNDGQRPDLYHFFRQKYKIVPEVIKRSIRNGELSFATM
jgi:hypothetical protein